MTARRITAHKGGRTARAPEARIRPQTLQRIRATMRERGASFADLLEEEYGGNEMTFDQVLEQLGSEATEENFHAAFDGKSIDEIRAELEEMFPGDKGNANFAREIYDYAD